MRRTASEVLRSLEMRVARLERQASMRTANKSDFDKAFSFAEQTSLGTLEAVVLPRIGRAIVANASDMETFLRKMGYKVTSNQRESMKREKGKLYILESSTRFSRERGHLFMMGEEQIWGRPGERRGYDIYK